MKLPIQFIKINSRSEIHQMQNLMAACCSHYVTVVPLLLGYPIYRDRAGLRQCRRLWRFLTYYDAYLQK
jgi:hypothetical protein